MGKEAISKRNSGKLSDQKRDKEFKKLISKPQRIDLKVSAKYSAITSNVDGSLKIKPESKDSKSKSKDSRSKSKEVLPRKSIEKSRNKKPEKGRVTENLPEVTSEKSNQLLVPEISCDVEEIEKLSSNEKLEVSKRKLRTSKRLLEKKREKSLKKSTLKTISKPLSEPIPPNAMSDNQKLLPESKNELESSKIVESQEIITQSDVSAENCVVESADVIDSDTHESTTKGEEEFIYSASDISIDPTSEECLVETSPEITSPTFEETEIFTSNEIEIHQDDLNNQNSEDSEKVSLFISNEECPEVNQGICELNWETSKTSTTTEEKEIHLNSLNEEFPEVDQSGELNLHNSPGNTVEIHSENEDERTEVSEEIICDFNLAEDSEEIGFSNNVEDDFPDVAHEEIIEECSELVVEDSTNSEDIILLVQDEETFEENEDETIIIFNESNHEPEESDEVFIIQEESSDSLLTDQDEQIILFTDDVLEEVCDDNSNETNEIQENIDEYSENSNTFLYVEDVVEETVETTSQEMVPTENLAEKEPAGEVSQKSLIKLAENSREGASKITSKRLSLPNTSVASKISIKRISDPGKSLAVVGKFESTKRKSDEKDTKKPGNCNKFLPEEISQFS